MNQKIIRTTVFPLLVLFGLAACGPGGGPRGNKGADGEQEEVAVPVETAFTERGLRFLFRHSQSRIRAGC